MKAVQYSSYGGPEVLKINEVEKPVLKTGQILVEVHAASINPIDWKVRLGYLKEAVPLTFPVTIGGDFSGVVSNVAEGVAEFKPGDEVYGSSIILSGGSGSFAEFTATNLTRTAFKPKKIDHVQAASLPLVGSHVVKPQVDKVFPLKEVQKAFEYQEKGHPRGKVVLQISSFT